MAGSFITNHMRKKSQSLTCYWTTFHSGQTWVCLISYSGKVIQEIDTAVTCGCGSKDKSWSLFSVQVQLHNNCFSDLLVDLLNV